MPPINEFIEKGNEFLQSLSELFDVRLCLENGDDSDADSDLEMGGVTQKYLCPLTLTLLVNPVTSLVIILLSETNILLTYPAATFAATAIPGML